MNKNIKIVFMGTPIFGAHILESLIKQQYNVIAVVTQPDKKVGREQKIQYSPVKRVAFENNIKVFQPEKIKEDFKEIVDLKADFIITAAYGQIIPSEILKSPKYEALNVHGSLLPKYRGGAPIHYSVINGDNETGVTIMEMVDKMDAGDIYSQKSFAILEDDTTEIVHDKMKEVGSKLLIETLPKIINKEIQKVPQDENKVTYSPNISKEMESIDFTKTKKEIHNLVRGLYSWPIAYTIFKNKRYKIHQTKINDEKINNKYEVGDIVLIDQKIYFQCVDGLLEIIKIQPEGKKVQLAKEFINGFSDFAKESEKNGI